MKVRYSFCGCLAVGLVGAKLQNATSHLARIRADHSIKPKHDSAPEYCCGHPVPPPLINSPGS